jgi:hypothetical protein
MSEIKTFPLLLPKNKMKETDLLAGQGIPKVQGLSKTATK